MGVSTQSTWATQIYIPCWVFCGTFQMNSKRQLTLSKVLSNSNQMTLRFGTNWVQHRQIVARAVMQCMHTRGHWSSDLHMCARLRTLRSVLPIKVCMKMPHEHIWQRSNRILMQNTSGAISGYRCQILTGGNLSN